jgi:2-desacetyl-2-hydroxyethyl bacteriochlorophyllide A dehydrogenase
VSATNPTVVFTAPRQIEIEERPLPAPRAGEVLIESRVSLISTGTEMSVLDGDPAVGAVWRELRRYPYVAGYSNVGEVVDIGEGVDPSWVGRRVDSHSPHAAYVTCATAELRPVPAGVADEEAALATLAEVAMNGVRRSQLTWGESAAVVGLGLLGQLTARIARLAGARPVFGIDLAAERLRHLPAGGGFVPLLGEAAELADVVRGPHREQGVDVAFETSGSPRAIPGEALLLRPQGRLVLVSSPSGPTAYDFHDLCNRTSLSLIGAHYFSHPPQASFDNPWTARRHGELFLDWLAAGDLRVGDLITHRIPGERAPEAYALLRERRLEALGVVFDWRTDAGRETVRPTASRMQVEASGLEGGANP